MHKNIRSVFLNMLRDMKYSEKLGRLSGDSEDVIIKCSTCSPRLSMGQKRKKRLIIGKLVNSETVSD